MKVEKINSVTLNGKTDNTVNTNQVSMTNPVKELANVTPDFNVKVPKSFVKIGNEKLENGLEIHRYKLSNGYNVTIVPMEDSPAVVKSYVNVGSLNETKDIKGISHFLEHMAFNGTNGENGHMKLNTGDSFKQINKAGGWSNASTNYAITDYVNSTPLLKDSDLELQIKVLSAMTEDLKLSEKMIEKEKGPVSSEINMILDDPQTIALDQTVRTLFNIKNPADELVGGSVDIIKNLSRKDVMDYYNKYYTPDNINIVVTGDINPEKAIKLISKNFTSDKISKGRKYEETIKPINKTVRKDFISDKATSTEIVLGFAGAKNNDTRSKVLFDLAGTYLSSPMSGLYSNIKEYNTFPLIADDKISTNPNNPRLSYIVLSTADENCENVLNGVYKTLNKRKPVTDEQLQKLKQKLRNMKDRSMEYSINLNDTIGKAVLDNDINYVTEYTKILDSVTAEELNNSIDRFFDLNKAAITVVHPSQSKTNSISFKGSNRKPLKEENISQITLPNNYDIGFYKTQSNNIDTEIRLITETPYNKKAGVSMVLNEIFDMGIKDKMDEDELEALLDENGLNMIVSSSSGGINLSLKGSKENYIKGLEIGKDVLENPAITEENLEKAKRNVRDNILREQDSSDLLYYNYNAQNNPYEFTREETLKELDSITLTDVQDCYKYLTENSRGIVTANIPKSDSDVHENIVDMIYDLPEVKPNIYKQLDIYKENPEVNVLTKPYSNSQADIMESFKFKFDNKIENILAGFIMNSMLSSSSIGLFDTLREKEHLAYSVHSSISTNGNEGTLNLNILTTTDNKEINDISYENVQKSIDGFNRQINELISGKFTDEDLENAKLSMKADLLNNEGSFRKVIDLNTAIASQYGSDYQNKLFDAIDNITRADITEYAKKVFSSKPTYSVLASKDTLEYNKEYFESLKNPNRYSDK